MDSSDAWAICCRAPAERDRRLIPISRFAATSTAIMMFFAFDQSMPHLYSLVKPSGSASYSPKKNSASSFVATTHAGLKLSSVTT